MRRTNARARAVFAPEHASISAAGRNANLGLALSGGGIRSAAFAMGVMRGLSDTPSPEGDGRSMLDRIGYLSTVSGGGYAGGWYVAHSCDDELMQPGSRHLQRVAGTANYLVSSHYSETWTDLADKGLLHVAGLPVAFVVDELFHLQFNVYGVRDQAPRALQPT